jgi:hypothetical protein
MIGIIFGGLLVTAVFLYPAVQLKKRRKWSILQGILMVLAGLGLVGIAFWLTGLLAGNLTLVLIVGGVALVLTAGFGIGVVADLSDGKIDYPWFVFALPSLIAVLLLTGSQTFNYIGDQIQTNADTISSRVSR